jgi:restriction endonuclease Mrr
LDRKIYSRLNKTLTRDKDIELENDIKQLVFDIKQELESEDERTRKAVEEGLASIIEPYKSELTRVKAQEEERKKLNETIEKLSEYSALEFEEWFADILKELEYEKVTPTPSSNDEGIDILAEKEGLKVAIQCKHWKKKKVGRPEVQAFLGAIQHAQLTRGILVTTGLFTEGARKMADEHPIKLIDDFELRNLIQEIRQK